MSTSAELHRRRLAAVAKGVGSTIAAYVDHAADGTLTDVDGREWIDFASGIAVTNVGNAAPKVVEAVRRQVERFTHTCFMVAPYESYVAVCEQLIAATPGTFEKRAALFNSGAEAVENAVKIARHATGRPAVVVFDHAYHGRTNLTMALTAKNMPYKHRFGPFAPEVYRAPMSYPLRDGGLDGAEAARRAIDVIEKQVGAGNVAAVLIEPIQGEGGFIVPAPGFLPALAAWAAEAGAVFIADEIQTGFCRTGQWFAAEHERLQPDLITTAKGMGGGLPIAGVVGRADLMDAVHAGGLGGTYGGNPVACAAALAAIETMRDRDLPAAARRIGSVLLPALTALKDEGIADVRGRGAMIAVELVKPGGIEPDPVRTAAISQACHAAGLLTLTCGTYGNVLRFLPPLVIPDAALHRGIDILTTAFHDN
ncbi:4-aminobutyrate aminotransferase [Actinoplanes sp. SE50]|uniref:4-aminobutyrate--2-oxoglutarate transaminase n=1 Tax=unclassified Actinoplanes TaxID=2626549 RepID=UPI00023ED5A5|nr:MULTISPECIES: 4-aminobutyrate--2-oxoglutarate transaminase [unclassified Actinoplanes]AEV83372.1 4-aminobutyrate aminotransferase / (S)-3-amino-2-methylpropionate transaminase [Actinoplanes sp. SE50/110]ATO81765.1 4-aminobutyrate aminotransferase [Actinoplanes sp. SE50]SLL99173.1 aspartate aminotransferase family protein [Actinoplanes sp. SE50/110]